MTAFAVLRSMPFLAALTDEEVQSLSRYHEEVTFDEAGLICRQGDPGDGLYIIASGAVLVGRFEEGSEDVYATLSSGQIFGHLAVIDEGPRSADCRASAGTRLLYLTRENYRRLVERRDSLAHKVLDAMAETVAQMLRHANSRLDDLAACGSLDEATAAIRSTERRMSGWH